MTKLSVNINEVALLRNSRDRNFRSVRELAARCLGLEAHGITLHPRPDQRHSKYSDIQGLLEVSIGHALVVECIKPRISEVTGRYLTILRDSTKIAKSFDIGTSSVRDGIDSQMNWIEETGIPWQVSLQEKA